MAKTRVKKFEIIDKKLIKFLNENNVQPNNKANKRLRDKPQANK